MTKPTDPEWMTFGRLKELLKDPYSITPAEVRWLIENVGAKPRLGGRPNQQLLQRIADLEAALADAERRAAMNGDGRIDLPRIVGDFNLSVVST